ncbi:transposase [Streptosporangium canum]
MQVEPPGGIFTEPDDHGLGRSRGGLMTKLHLAVEQAQKPMSLVITAGQRGDSPQFQMVLERIRVPRLGPSRPRTRPDKVRADKAYGSRAQQRVDLVVGGTDPRVAEEHCRNLLPRTVHRH